VVRWKCVSSRFQITTIDQDENAMTRTYRVNTSKIKIYPFRHNPLRDFRQAESKYHFLENRDLGYKPRSRHLLSQSNLTSAWDDVYKGVFADKWAGKKCDRYFAKNTLPDRTLPDRALTSG
jgi:hypothetical protein